MMYHHHDDKDYPYACDMNIDIQDWREYKRLRGKFSGPAFEALAARVQAVFRKPVTVIGHGEGN